MMPGFLHRYITMYRGTTRNNYVGNHGNQPTNEFYGFPWAGLISLFQFHEIDRIQACDIMFKICHLIFLYKMYNLRLYNCLNEKSADIYKLSFECSISLNH